MYIPQRTAMLEGTPLDFVERVRSFAVHRRAKTAYADPIEIALEYRSDLERFFFVGGERKKKRS